MQTLEPYQRRMADRIQIGTGTYLALPVGLGKSAIASTAVERMVDAGEAWSALVIAPKKVAEHTWPEEVKTWAPGLSVSLIVGTPKERLRAVMRSAALHVIGIDNVQWLVETFGAKWPYHVLIIDEAQRFKDPGGKRFKALKKVMRNFDCVVLMSATPASEALLGLWSQIYLIDGGQRLGRTYSQFRGAFFESDYMGWNWSLRQGAEVEIHRRLADVMVSLDAGEHVQLPERIDNYIRVLLPDVEMERYRQMERDYLLPFNGQEITAANAAVLSGKLLQMAGGAAYGEDGRVIEIHSAKLDALLDLVDAANGNPVLVFYGYHHEVSRIKRAIKGAEELDIDKWNAGKQRVALAHPASAGAGLNLQFGGHVVCWYSLPWSLELYIQACGRLHRRGQKERVIINHLVAEGTIDNDVVSALADKDSSQRRLLDAIREHIKDATQPPRQEPT